MNKKTDIDNEITQNRVGYIDIARGIGIILVVFYHIYNDPDNVIVNNVINAFFMPLFFIISGINFRIKTDFAQFFAKKAYSLLVPYFIFASLSWLYWALFERSFRSAEAQIPVIQGFKGIFLANYPNVIYNSVLWFLPALFVAEIVFALIEGVVKNKYFTAASMTAFAAAGILLWVFEIPLGINSAAT